MVDLILEKPTVCRYCGSPVVFTSNAEIYGKEYGNGKCFLCRKCKAYVGVHTETQIKNETLEELLQGTLYEMYKHYRDLANSYQGNCISKEKVKDKLKKLKIEKEKAKGRKDNIVERYTIENKINILQEILKESEE